MNIHIHIFVHIRRLSRALPSLDTAEAPNLGHNASDPTLDTADEAPQGLRHSASDPTLETLASPSERLLLNLLNVHNNKCKVYVCVCVCVFMCVCICVCMCV